MPIWAFGTLAALAILALSLNYGSSLRWQIRAQNAADAAARGLLAIQTTQFNQTIATLHGAAIEEYRMRYLINDMLETIQGSGGCDNTPGASGPASCNAMYQSLRQNYLDSLQRYTNDALILNRVSYPSQADQIAQIKAALDLYQSPPYCGTVKGGDCAFKYTLVAAVPRRDSWLEDVYADCCGFDIGGGTTGHPKGDIAPLMIEVVACANVQPLLPGIFGKVGPQAFEAIGRAAATSIMSSQEFMYVGSLVNPVTNKVFQPAEYPESPNNLPVFSDNDPNYRIDFGGSPNDPNNYGNPAVSDGKFGFTYTPANEGILAATGWWQSMSVRPFSGNLTPGKDFTCK